MFLKIADSMNLTCPGPWRRNAPISRWKEGGKIR
jgi:hypothetical protein